MFEHTLFFPCIAAAVGQLSPPGAAASMPAPMRKATKPRSSDDGRPWLPSDWARCVVLLEEESTADGKKCFEPVGTAFLLRHRGVTFLVTARHVITRSHTIARVNLRSARSDRSHTVRTRLDAVQKATGSGWFFHPTKKADVAVLVYPVDARRADVRPIDTDLLRECRVFADGDDIRFLGFPLGITEKGHVHPVVRGGLVAQKRHDDTFLIDALVFPGNSGGPVFLKEYELGGARVIGGPCVIGLISEFISYVDTAVSTTSHRPRVQFEENAGLAVCCGMRYVLDILDRPDLQRHYREAHGAGAPARPKRRQPA